MLTTTTLVQAVHALKPIEPDPVHETHFAAHLRATASVAEIEALYGRFLSGTAPFDAMMRRVVWRALVRTGADGLHVATGALFRHLATVSMGAGVHVGEHSLLQGRHDGACVIGEKTWIGPHAVLDARDLRIGRAVGIGPGVRILCAQHSGEPGDRPVIATGQKTARVVIEDGADLGTGSTILPGVTVGAGAIVGAGAVVTRDVQPMTVVAGVPARFLRPRTPSDMPR